MSSETSVTGPTATPVAIPTQPHVDSGDETTAVALAEEETVFTLAPATGVTYIDEPRVAGFVEAHRLGGYVDAAVALARKCFPKAKGFALEMFGEPGEYGERLYLDVAVGGVDESLRQRREFVKQWIAATPPWVTDLMGLSTDLR